MSTSFNVLLFSFFKERPAINPKSPNTCRYFMICSHKNNNFFRSYNINFHRTYVYIYMLRYVHINFTSSDYSIQNCHSIFTNQPKKTRRSNVPALQHGSLNVPIEHHPTMNGIWSTRWLLFQVMSNIPKMGQLPTSRSKSLNEFILFRIHGTIPAIGPPVRAPGHGWSAGLSPKIEDTQRAQQNLGNWGSWLCLEIPSSKLT